MPLCPEWSQYPSVASDCAAVALVGQHGDCADWHGSAALAVPCRAAQAYLKVRQNFLVANKDVVNNDFMFSVCVGRPLRSNPCRAGLHGKVAAMPSHCGTVATTHSGYY